MQGIPLKNNDGLIHSFSDIPEKAVSIVSLDTIMDLEKKISKPINPLRFRPNFLISGGIPWEEFKWINKKRQIGECVLQVFKKMNFIKFWAVSTLFFITFPISLVFCLVCFGFIRTKQLIMAFISDFVQSLLIIILLILIVVYFLIDYLSMYFT